MKTLSFTIAIIIAGSIFLSSCKEGSSITFTKRHYTKGYYVDFNSGHGTESPKNSVVSNNKDNVSVTASAVQPDVNPKALNNNNTTTSPKIAAKKLISKIALIQNKTTSSNEMKQISYKSPLSVIAVPNLILRSNAQFESAPQNITTTNQDGDHRVHSLFWLVITIVLILWLIGILTGSFGIGALINLLLLVALVLLVLWLLWLI